MEKIPGGKLIRVKADYDTYYGKINNVMILGDFFIYPEEAIEKIESIFSGLSVDFDENELMKYLEEFVKNNNIELIGINCNAIVRVVKKAVKSEIKGSEK